MSDLSERNFDRLFKLYGAAMADRDAMVKALEWIADVASTPSVVKVARDALSRVGTPTHD